MKTVEIGAYYKEFSHYAWHYYRFFDDRVLHVNSIPLINVFYYDNCFGSGMQPKLVIDKNLHTLQTHDFFHVEMNVMNCSQNEFKSELLATLNQLKVFQCFDMKKMFDLSRSQVAITSLEDLL